MNGEGIKAVKGTDEKGQPIVELVDGEGGILLRLPMMNEGGAPLAKRSDERGAGKRFGGRFLRAKVMMLATALALTVGLSSMALAANGKPFLLGKNNAATAISTLTKQGPGPALRLLVRPGQPPLAVNSTVKVANLNADKVDGLDSSAFLGVGQKAVDAAHADEADSATNADQADSAANADRLDNLNSTDFQRANASARGDLTGNYPNPSIADDAVETSNFGAIPTARARFFSTPNPSAASGESVFLAFNSEEHDVGNLHDNSENNSRLTAPVDGVYAITANVAFSADPNGYRRITLIKNRNEAFSGSILTQFQGPPTNSPGLTTDQTVSTQARLSAGDHVEVRIHQNSGETLTILGGSLTHFEMTWIAPG